MSAPQLDFTYMAFDTRCGFAADRLQVVAEALRRDDLIAALRAVDSFSAILGDLVADVTQAAYNEGHTKAAIARALGIPASHLRGMVRDES